MDIKIMVATHKKYWMPKDDIYLPIHVGKHGKEYIGYIGDDTGDNISYKNNNYCELTALYWAWKNLKNDYVGLAHYRRHYTTKSSRILGGEYKGVLNRRELEEILRCADVVLPNKQKYYIETNRSQYNHAHNKRDLEMTENIVREIFPEYSSAFSYIMNKRSSHMFNMFIMKKRYFDEYCAWLFFVLFELERRIERNGLLAEPRLYGFIGEKLLDIWIETKKLPYKEIDFVFMEKQNWLKKGGMFLKRKFLGV